jgi:hypothetical protein
MPASRLTKNIRVPAKITASSDFFLTWSANYFVDAPAVTLRFSGLKMFYLRLPFIPESHF